MVSPLFIVGRSDKNGLFSFQVGIKFIGRSDKKWHITPPKRNKTVWLSVIFAIIT
jgi:hypothetical protein